MPPTTPSQKALLSQFIAITGAPEKTAAKTLKASQWKLDQACDSYYLSTGSAPNAKEKEALGKLFEKYRGKSFPGPGLRIVQLEPYSIPDQKTDENDTIGVEGTMKYFGDLAVDLESVECLVPMEIVQAPTLGEITKDGFVDGWKTIGADTVTKQKAHVLGQIKQLHSDMALFKRVYRYTFVCTKEKGQKALALENALIYWGLLFNSPGIPWVTPSTNWIELWSEFLRSKWTKSVNKDMWNQTFEFFQRTMQDETLSFWSEDSAWPGVIDEFVAYAKEKRGQSAENMETD